MSYEIIKNCRIECDKETGKYYAVIKSACNNVYPHYYEEWTLGKDSKYNFTKEELEKELLLQFFHGNFQKGSSRFRKAVKLIRCNDKHLLDRYYRLDDLYFKVSSRMWKHYNDGPQYERYSKLAAKIREARDSEAKEVLYKYMKGKTKELGNTKVEPFVIIEKSTGYYVSKVTKTKYYTHFIGNKPTIHTSRALWQRVNDSKWWKDHFIIENVSAVLT